MVDKVLGLKFLGYLSGGSIVELSLTVTYTAKGPSFEKDGGGVGTIDGSEGDADWYFQLPPIVAKD